MELKSIFDKSHKRINDGLSIVVILLALYIILLPFLPNLLWFVRNELPLFNSETDTSISLESSKPEFNTLLIPSIDLEEQIYEGSDVSVVNKGIWRRPMSSNPITGGNTVLAGHRFIYSGPAVLYHLDKVKVGDEVGVYWDDQLIVYEVEDVSVVSPAAVEIEAPTNDNRLTIYTCTPLISAKDRLVVIARPI